MKYRPRSNGINLRMILGRHLVLSGIAIKTVLSIMVFYRVLHPPPLDLWSSSNIHVSVTVEVISPLTWSSFVVVVAVASVVAE